MELRTYHVTSGRWEEPGIDAQVPTNIHLDLQRSGQIPDPFVGTNEKDVQWVMNEDFTFQFELPSEVQQLASSSLSNWCIALVLEGLDTFATVQIAGKEVLESENMFISHRIDITKLLSSACTDGIKIRFASAKARGDELLKSHGQRVCWNGHYSRVYVRKAQYHYGWDWGPSLVTCGPWKPIYVELYTARLDHIKVVSSLSPDLKHATATFGATIESLHQQNPEGFSRQFFISVTVTSPSGKEHCTVLNLPSSQSPTEYTSTISIQDPELWYPRQHGAQSIYTATFILTTSSASSSPSTLTHAELHSSPVLHTVTKRFGLRRAELIQDTLPSIPNDPLSGGSTFYFRINNIPVFCGGSNWIPADSFQPRISREKLKHWLHSLLSSRGNQSMVRVWGGGVYESEDFYELCDEAGILVWQDICLACGDYPAHLDYFSDSIQAEVTQNLERLRWHPSLVLVAGSNEDYQVADEEVGYVPDAPEDTWRCEPFPSRWLYEKRFAEIVRDVCNDGKGGLIGKAGTDSTGVLYWPGSPFGGLDSTDRTVGDTHQWNIWGGIQAPYQRYPDLGSRFISEFGMISLPCLETIKSGFLSPTSPLSELHPQSETLAHHIKVNSFEKRMIAYITENFRFNSYDLDEFIYLAQSVQADAMRSAFKGWRVRWGTSYGRSCGGALVWQMNDCWPVTSWSLCDYYARPKQAFYTIARALSPVALCVRRFTTGVFLDSRVEALANSRTATHAKIKKLHATPHVYPPKKSRVRVHLSSISRQDMDGLHVQIRYIDIATGRSETIFKPDKAIVAHGNETEEVFDADVPEQVPTLVYAVAYDSSGEVVATETDWPQPLKWVPFQPDRGVKVDLLDTAEGQKEASDVREVRVSAEKPVKGIWFDEQDGETWSDNGMDIVPGEVCKIKVQGMGGRKEVSWRAYGIERQTVAS